MKAHLASYQLHHADLGGGAGLYEDILYARRLPAHAPNLRSVGAAARLSSGRSLPAALGVSAVSAATVVATEAVARAGLSWTTGFRPSHCGLGPGRSFVRRWRRRPR